MGGGLDIDLANALAFEGELVELVTLTRPGEYRDSFMRGLSFHQFSLGSGLRSGLPGLFRHKRAAQAFLQALENNQLKPAEIKTIPLSGVPAAMVEILAGHTVGKVVLTVNGA